MKEPVLQNQMSLLNGAPSMEPLWLQPELLALLAESEQRAVELPAVCRHQEGQRGVKQPGAHPEHVPRIPAYPQDHMILRSSRISERSLGDGPVFMVCQNPDPLNRTSDSLLLEYIYV